MKLGTVCILMTTLSGCAIFRGCEKKAELICDENGCRWVGSITCPAPRPTPTPTPPGPWARSVEPRPDELASVSAVAPEDGWEFRTCVGWFNPVTLAYGGSCADHN